MPRGTPAKSAARKKAKKTLQQIADEQGVTRQAIYEQEKLGEKGTNLAEELKLAQIRKTNASADKEEEALKVFRLEYIKRSVVEEDGAIIAFVVGELIQDIRSECGPMLEGLTAAEIDDKVGPWMDRWEERLKDETEKIWDKAREAVTAELRGDLKKASAAQKRKEK